MSDLLPADPAYIAALGDCLQARRNTLTAIREGIVTVVGAEDHFRNEIQRLLAARIERGQLPALASSVEAA